MLKQRIITAIILLVILIGTLVMPTSWPFMVLLSVMAGCALWEWLRLTLMPGAAAMARPAGFLMAISLIVAGSQVVARTSDPQMSSFLSEWAGTGIPLVSVLWVVGGTAMVLRANTEGRRHAVALSVFGVLAVLALWFSLVQLFVTYGAWCLVSMMALIWFADSVAYFTGRALGRHKLAPRISPGKTWEGALGGVVGAVLWMAVSTFWGESFAAILVQRWGYFLMLVMVVLLAALSIVGDLFESLLKRRASVKDSSQLLPGHGGVYDRIDALFPVAPLALWLVGGV